MVERTIRQFADGSGTAGPPVIKWIGTPTDAFDHLSRLGLDALLDMGSASFWRPARPPVAHAIGAFDGAFEVRMAANEIRGAEEHDRTLMAPKLRAKSGAMAPFDRGSFRDQGRLVALAGNSMADAAAQAVSDVELLLSTGASESSAAIDDQLKIFES
jgi:hypothetical protein